MTFTRRLLAVAALLLQGCFSRFEFDPLGFEPYRTSGAWVVSGAQAAALYRQGARFLDARKGAAWSVFHAQGSWPVAWERFSEPSGPRGGLLLGSDAKLEELLRELGVSSQIPVVVVDDPQTGWGEGGRIVWTLRTLGHSRAVLVDGGYDALLRAGVPITARATPPAPGDFTVRRDGALTILADELSALLDEGAVSSGRVRLTDTRERREYEGETPYGESRGGHVPGAVHLHYADLLNAKGYLLPRAQILGRLAALGMQPSQPIVTYCSGGVRSAWLLVVLKDLGFSDVRNYAGSMWEWSAEDPSRYPLESVAGSESP